jgi:protein tyrosine phosphatase
VRSVLISLFFCRSDKTAHASKLLPHKKLNRYANISAYDWSRVKIKPTPPQNSDYINANYIDGYDHASGYIASQGPVPGTQDSFWQMCWENNCQVIVMVTNEVEGGKTKCQRYWPDSPNEVSSTGGATSKNYGPYNVTHVGEDVFPNYIKRVLTLKYKGSSRKIVHFLYTAWPDHGVPDTAKEMLGFRSVVKEQYSPENPMLVHCSAGVGRTGTFIGIDRYLDACAALDSRLGVLDIVRNMRASRNYMVQAQAQFTYLYSAVREGLVQLLSRVSLALMDEQDAATKMVREIEADASAAQSGFMERTEAERVALLKAMAATAGGEKQRTSVGASVSPDVVGERGTNSKTYTADIEVTQRQDSEARKMALHQSSQKWVTRGNVPMSPEEHGYVAANSVLPIPTRLVALSEARAQWMTRYAEADRTWQAEHDTEGVMYDIGASLTPLESRVSSLAASEEQWQLRSGSSASVEDERSRAELAELTLRLESLQYTVLNAERRWRARGDSSDTNPELDDTEGVHTSGRLGGLGDRLKLLASEQTKYQERHGWNPYDLQKFHEDIIAVAEEQEKLGEEREEFAAAEEEARLEKDAKDAAALASKATEARASKLEVKRKSDIKKTMMESSKFHGSHDHPTLVRKKAEEAAAKQAAKEKKAVEELQKAEDAKAKKALSKSIKSKAAKDAQKFLAKQKGKK